MAFTENTDKRRHLNIKPQRISCSEIENMEIEDDFDDEDEGLPVVKIPEYINARRYNGEQLQFDLACIEDVWHDPKMPHSVKCYMQVGPLADALIISHTDYKWLCEHWFKIPPKDKPDARK